ncbi:unnamed protein product [Arctia plantaginis]|uniref:Cuticle protein 1 n=1 Tax=Arctia plantaginis TaxID=874455 RepID=A0A8S1A1L3_ARCPL|nr:unnamed protein product [Arctia plantaginis]CAB3262058.1 unnamed protein product [Arctia plantaginis]
MRFLIAFVAILGYASAGAIGPLVYGINAGDAQAAAIDATVAAQDHARAVGESQARAAEAAIQYNTEAVRQAAEVNRNIHENSYWGSLAANQNAVAAAQSYAAAANGVAAAAQGAYLSAPYGYNGLAAPYGLAAPLGIAAPYGIHGLGAGWAGRVW